MTGLVARCPIDGAALEERPHQWNVPRRRFGTDPKTGRTTSELVYEPRSAPALQCSARCGWGVLTVVRAGQGPGFTVLAVPLAELPKQCPAKHAGAWGTRRVGRMLIHRCLHVADMDREGHCGLPGPVAGELQGWARANAAGHRYTNNSTKVPVILLLATFGEAGAQPHQLLNLAKDLGLSLTAGQLAGSLHKSCKTQHIQRSESAEFLPERGRAYRYWLAPRGLAWFAELQRSGEWSKFWPGGNADDMDQVGGGSPDPEGADLVPWGGLLDDNAS